MGIKNINLIVAGLVLLLVSAYIDNLRGPLIPILKDLYQLNYTQSGFFVFFSYPVAILFSFALGPLFNKFGTKSVAYGICVLGLATFVFPLLVDSYSKLLAFGVMIGAATSTFGTLCNILVIQGTESIARVRMMCALHMMYGAGSFVAPSMVTMLQAQGIAWNWYFLIGPPLLIVLIIVALKTAKIDDHEERIPQSMKISYRELIAVMCIALYVGAEVVTSMWLSSYLQDVKGLSLSESGFYLSLFFGFIFFSRMLGFFVVRPHNEVKAYWIALFAGAAGLGIGYLGYYWGFGLAGCMGLFFPVFLGRASTIFQSSWRSMTIWTLVVMQITLMILHFTVGNLADAVGLEIAFYLPMILIIAALLMVFYFKHLSGPDLKAPQTS